MIYRFWREKILAPSAARVINAEFMQGSFNDALLVVVEVVKGYWKIKVVIFRVFLQVRGDVVWT